MVTIDVRGDPLTDIFGVLGSPRGFCDSQILTMWLNPSGLKTTTGAIGEVLWMQLTRRDASEYANADSNDVRMTV